LTARGAIQQLDLQSGLQLLHELRDGGLARVGVAAALVKLRASTTRANARMASNRSINASLEREIVSVLQTVPSLKKPAVGPSG